MKSRLGLGFSGVKVKVLKQEIEWNYICRFNLFLFLFSFYYLESLAIFILHFRVHRVILNMADNDPHELDIAQVFVDRVGQELENRDATEF